MLISKECCISKIQNSTYTPTLLRIKNLLLNCIKILLPHKTIFKTKYLKNRNNHLK